MSIDDRVNYSPTEERLLRILRRRKNPIDSVTLCELYHADKDERSRAWHAQGVINAAMNSLIKKVAHNGEPFIIEKSGRKGPHPSSFWLVEKAAAETQG